MDSGNSGSLQSSSGGDEEYDSRAESSISAFLVNHSPSHAHAAGPFTTVHPQPPPPPQSLQTLMLDPLSNYLDPMQRPPSLVSLDMMWSKPGTDRSEPNLADLGGLIPCSSSSSTQLQNQALFSSQLVTRSTSFSALNHHLPPESASRGLLSVSAATSDQAQNTNSNTSAATNNDSVVRNPKKRSRASRRAPTTVLTTDTTNFRAMVQEFTGIPAPPFTSSPFPRSRFDLFGSATIRSPHLDPPPPPYLLRPFAQKVESPSHPFVSPPSSSIPSFPTSSSMVETVGTVASNSSTNSASINYQLSSDLGLLKQPPQNFLNMNMHTPSILNFQSILKYPLENSSIPQTTDSHLKMGALEEFGLSQGNVGAASGLHNLLSSSSSNGALARVHTFNNPSSNWAAGRGTNNDDDHGVLRSLSGNTERGTNGKVNFPASSLDFHGDKGPECVAARTEGTLESWINCSSD